MTGGTSTSLYDFSLDEVRAGRGRRQPNRTRGYPSPENSPQAARIDALLYPVRKIDLAGIEDERARAIVGLLLNLVEDLRGALKKAQAGEARQD
jgi:hypothetical protein